MSNITYTFEQALLGSIIGDGSIYRCNNKNGTFGYYYNEKHSLKQKDYAKFKIKIFGENLPVYYWHNSYEDMRTNKVYNSISFKSRVSSKLETYYNLIYLNNKKIIQMELLNLLKPEGIAFWFMDDGTYDYGTNNISLATNCFTLEEHKLLQFWFKSKYDIDFKIQEYKSHYLLRANNQSSKRFIKLTEKYILPKMKYKIGKDKLKKRYAEKRLEKYRENNKEIIQEKTKNARKTPHYKNRINEYYIKNKKQILIKQKEWRSKNKDKQSIYRHKYNHKDINKTRVRWREYYHLNKDKINSKKRKKRKSLNIKKNLSRLK